MASEIVKVRFYEDELDAVGVGADVRVSLRRVCENLGLAMQGQLTKLKGKGWACVTEIVTHDASGRKQATTMIDLDTLSGWLLTINAGKVKPAVRAKLGRYQKEACRVLREHFFGRATPDAGLAAIATSVTALAAVVREMQDDQRDIRRELAELRAGRTAALNAVPCRESCWTVAGWLDHKEKDWKTTSRQRRKIGQLAKRDVETRMCRLVRMHGDRLAFGEDETQFLAHAVDTVKREAEAAKKKDGYGIFAEHAGRFAAN